ncbi:DUF4328 domain-containing protein [Streptomyces sp. NPDC058872]|uniref:DUF4328 domain-containing protein n=1 Tax=Streptomyces sp. NPDC058872 TaxID=3346661 RepID=UPI00369ECCB7
MLTLRNPKGLSYALVALLAGNVLFDVLLALADVRSLVAGGIHLFDPTVFGALDLNLASSMAFTLFAVTGVVFIVWFRRLRKNAEVWAADLQGRKPGWAVGSWFVPIANLWMPRGIAVDIWRASRGEPYAADGRGELALLNGWWTCWVVSGVVNQVSAQMYKTAETFDEYTTAIQWSLGGYAVDIAAAVLAILFVRRLTSMQHAKATGIIPAAQ